MAKKKKKDNDELQEEAQKTEKIEKKWFSKSQKVEKNDKSKESKVMVETFEKLEEDETETPRPESKTVVREEDSHSGLSVLARRNPTQHWKYRDVVEQRPSGARKYFRSK